jgi:3-carboxy-cis,cis-muconate cycloisomerase
VVCEADPVTSALFDPLFGATAVDPALDDRAWLSALCEVETALARACARAGLVPLAAALEVGAAAEQLSRSDPADLGRDAVAGGNPVIPLVDRLRHAVQAAAGDEAAAAVHLGATSQDVLDTAAMLVASRACGTIGAQLRDCADRTAELALQHRDTPMIARTLMQQALPTTFGVVAAGWGRALDRATLYIDSVRATLPVQLGGAAGTRAAWHPSGREVAAALADELGLVEPDGVWQTDRWPVLDVAAALGAAAAAVAKCATDIILLSQTELAELAEDEPGGSSAMAHKRNPIAAVTSRAAAAQVPGLVGTLYAAATPELQRGAGPWHAEWPALTALLKHTGGATSRLRAALTGLHVDAEAMQRNLGRDPDPTDLAAAAEQVEGYLARRRT